MKRILLTAALIGALSLAGCSNTSRDKTTEVTATQLHFDATVLEVGEHTLFVEPLKGAEERKTADRISISTDSIGEEKSIATLKALQPGDTIRIGYLDGMTETYPAGIDTVYEISLVETTLGDLPPMAMVDGTLYYDSGRESTIDGRCGVMDGEITSTVGGNEIPTEDGQSNFGTGYGYQRTGQDQIEIYINDKWMVFEPKQPD